MNKLELAASLIRPSLSSKLTDRAWIAPVFFSLLAWIAAFLGRVSFDAVMNLTMVLVGGAAVGEKVKDAVIGSSAVRGEVPQSVAVNNVDNGASSPAPASAGDVLKNAASQIVGNEVERATGIDLSQFGTVGFGDFSDGDSIPAEAGRDESGGLNDTDASDVQMRALLAQEAKLGDA